MRTIETMVTFRHPFVLAALGTAQPAGTYRLVTEEEEIPGILFTAWRRVETTLRLPAVDRSTGDEQVVAINPQDLAAALSRDIESSHSRAEQDEVNARSRPSERR